MAKETSSIMCPKCGTPLFEFIEQCEGVIIDCPKCGAKMLIDAHYNDSTIVRVKPTRKAKAANI